jgi:hypothetical protein
MDLAQFIGSVTHCTIFGFGKRRLRAVGAILGRSATAAGMAVAAVVASSAAAPAVGQCTSGVWVQANVPPFAQFRSDHALAFDSARGVSVCFTGANSGTWEYDGDGWVHRTFGGPTAPYGWAVAFDEARGTTVLTGGLDTDQMWTWDGSAWASLAIPRPAARRIHKMVYDSQRDIVVLFGGIGAAFFGDTWEWNGTSWSQASSTGPSPRYGHAMAFDSLRNVTVLFGGLHESGSTLGDTWTWNGTVWTQHVGPGPSGRLGSMLVFDPALGGCVLYGGNNTTNGDLADTWVWNGVSWTQLTVAGPPARRYMAHAFDSRRGTTVVFGGAQGQFGGTSETWEFVTRPVIRTQPVSRSDCPTAPAPFSVEAVGADLVYRWQWSAPAIRAEWTNIAEGINGDEGGSAGDPVFTAVGAATASVNVELVPGTPYTIADFSGFALRLVVTNACGSVTSDPAVLTLTACDCIDFNGDGLFPDNQDLQDFFGVFGGGTCSTANCGDLDFNNDQLFPDNLDIAAFFSVFGGGPCL